MRILGSNNVFIIDDMDAYFGKFNYGRCNKLLKVGEEIEDKGSAHANHNKLKNHITMKKETVEPKGKDQYVVNHCGRFIFNSNNKNGLNIEPDDRRFTCHQANNDYPTDQKYFDQIMNEIEDVQFCKNAFEFFANREYDVANVRKPYQNAFKINQKLINMPPGIRFIRDIIEGKHSKFIAKDGDLVKVSILNNEYEQWCKNNSIKYCSMYAFRSQLEDIGLKSVKKSYKGISQRCYIINREDLENKFSKFLKCDDFKFEDNEDDEDNENENDKKYIDV